MPGTYKVKYFGEIETQQVLLLEQELHILPEHLSSPWVLYEIRVYFALINYLNTCRRHNFPMKNENCIEMSWIQKSRAWVMENQKSSFRFIKDWFLPSQQIEVTILKLHRTQICTYSRFTRCWSRLIDS